MSQPSARRAAAEEFARRLRARLGDEMVRAILYGSVARGEEHAESDVDVVVIVRDSRARAAVDDEAWELLLERGILVQPFIATPEEWHRIEARGSRFAHDIRDEGEVLA